MIEALASAVTWAGLVLAAAGFLCLLRPMRWLRISTRHRAVRVFLGGAAMFLLAMILPASAKRAVEPSTQLDAWMPEWQFSEFHTVRVHATPDQVYRAIREVTGDEIWLLQTLTWIRNPRWPSRGPRPESILNPPAHKPILEVAMNGGFQLAAEEPPREVVLLTVVMSDGKTRPATNDAAGFRALASKPGFAIAAINFRVVEESGGLCTVTTETRVFATDAIARRTFARYWRVIYPGSSLLRYTWLRAIRLRAEKASV